MRAHEIAISQLKIGSPLILRGALTAMLVMGQSLILSHDNNDTLAKYTAYSGLETFIFTLVYEGLPAINTAVADEYQRLNAKEDSGTQNHDYSKIGIIFRQGIIFLFATTTIASLLALSAPLYYKLFGDSENVNSGVQSYFHLIIMCYFFDNIYRGYISLMIGLEKSKSPVIFDVIEGVLNLAFIGLFVFGPRKTFDLGVNGAAISCGISSFITFVAYHFYLRSRSDLEKFNLFTLQKPFVDKEILKKISVNGLCWSINALIKYSYVFILTLTMGKFGDNVLNAIVPAGSYALIVNNMIDGLSGVPISKLSAYASDPSIDLKFVKKYGNILIASTFFITTILGLLAAVSAKYIALAFSKNTDNCDDVCMLAIDFLRIQAVVQVLLNTSNMSGYVAIGVGLKKFPTAVALASNLVINLTLLFVSMHLNNKDSRFVNATQCVGLFIALCMNVVRFAFLSDDDIKQVRNIDDFDDIRSNQSKSYCSRLWNCYKRPENEEDPRLYTTLEID